MSFSIFLPIDAADLGQWRANRIFCACRSFGYKIDAHFDGKAMYVDHHRTGWTFFLSTAEKRDQIVTYYRALLDASC